MRFPFLLLLIGLPAFGQCPNCPAPVAFTAVNTAAERPKLLVMSASWCGPCKSLKATINGDEGQAALIGVAVEFHDYDSERSFFAKHGVRSFPTLILMENGKEVKRSSGGMSAGQLAAFVSKQFGHEETAHGWYAEDGTLSLYWKGERLGTLNPFDALWHTHGKDKPVNLIAAFGLRKELPKGDAKASKPSGCICQGECRCKDCPGDCTFAGNLLAFADDLTNTPMPRIELGGDDPFPGGVDLNKIPQQVTYRCNGEGCDRKRAFQHLLGRPYEGGLVDDRHKYFVTVVGSESFRSKVLADFANNPALSGLRSTIHLNLYDPSDWHVSQIGLANGITYQGPPNKDGQAEVLWRLPEQNYSAVALAEAIRKPGPYDPNSDPDPSKPKPKPDDKDNDGKPDGGWKLPNLADYWQPLAIVGLFIFILYTRKK